MIRFVLCATLLHLSAFALGPQDYTVKVLSCDQTKQGSGVIIQSYDKTLVITSEHVIDHDPESCHRVMIPNGELLEVKLHAVEWALGLASLEFEENAPKFDVLALERRDDKLETTITGYRRDQRDLTTLKNALPLPDKSQPLFLSGGELEAYDISAHYGMSGGGVFQLKKEGLVLVGINSHLFIEDSGKQRLLTIPAETILDWLSEISTSLMNPTARISQGRNLDLSGLQIKPVIPIDDRFLIRPGKMGKSGDPIGIGGDQLQLVDSDQLICLNIKVTDLKRNDLTHLPFSFRETFHIMKMKAYKRQDIELCYFYNNGDLIGFSSLEEFARLMAIGLKPVVRAKSPFSSPEEKDLHDVATSFAKNLEELSKFYDDDLIKKMQQLSEVMKTHSWEIISAQTLDDLIAHQDWDKLYNTDHQNFILITNLHSDLMRYRDIHQFIVVR